MFAPTIPVRRPRWSTPLPALLLAAAALLAGCASGPRGGSGRDGALPNPPSDLHKTPDAEPRVEPIRPGGPNKPYEVGGRSYVPETRDVPLREKGLASWYGRKFHGRRTASGEIYNMYAMTAAHRTLPIPSYARVRNPRNGKEVVVRINDRGPFHSDRIIDLSYTAALRLGVLNGVAMVELERITYDDIRTGAWRRNGPAQVDDTQLASVNTTAASPAPSAADDAGPPPGTASPGTAAVTPPDAPASALPLPSGVVPVSTAAAAQAPIKTAPEPSRAFTAAARGYWVQLGAFRDRAGAESFQQRVAAEFDWLAPLLAVFNEAPLHRLQAGPYATRDEAGSAAQRIRDALQLVPVIVERR